MASQAQALQGQSRQGEGDRPKGTAMGSLLGLCQAPGITAPCLLQQISIKARTALHEAQPIVQRGKRNGVYLCCPG